MVLVFKKGRRWLDQRNSNFNEYVNHLGVQLKCRFSFKRSEWAPDSASLTSSQVTQMPLVQGPHFGVRS